MAGQQFFLAEDDSTAAPSAEAEARADGNNNDQLTGNNGDGSGRLEGGPKNDGIDVLIGGNGSDFVVDGDNNNLLTLNNGDAAGASSAATESFTMNYTKIGGTYSQSAESLDGVGLEVVIASTSTATSSTESEDRRLGIQQSVEPVSTLEAPEPLAGDKTFEPETDDSEPGEPTRPDPADADSADGGRDYDPDDFIWDIGGAPPAEHGGFNMSIQFGPSTERSTSEFVGRADDPADEALLYGLNASEDYVDHTVPSDAEQGGGDIILVDLVGASATEPSLGFDDFLFG